MGLLCYIINSFKLMVGHLKKVHTLGRYYTTMHEPHHNIAAFVLT